MTGVMCHRLRVLLMVLVGVVLAVSGASASKVRQVNLEEMTQRAAKIFSGRCVDLREALDQRTGRKVTVLTIDVGSVAKGSVGSTEVVRMLGGLEEQQELAGRARFQKGEQVVLFLYGEGELGLTSPVGLGQGKFNVYKDKYGRSMALNGTGNHGLLAGLSHGAEVRLERSTTNWKEAQPVETAALLEMARSLSE